MLYPDDLDEPPVPIPKDGEAPEVRVEFKVCFEDISSIDTLNGTVMAKLWIGLAWLDPRLYGCTKFPEEGWTPSIVMKNCVGNDFIYECHTPKITDPETGQCYRLFCGTGNFMCAMDLHEYPFDNQTLDFVIRSESMHVGSSKLKSNPVRFERYGSMAEAVYPKDPNPRVLYFDDDFYYTQANPEWSFQSLRLYNHNKEENSTSGVDDAQLMTIKVKVQREYMYYLSKMVSVLSMLSILTLAAIKMDPITEYSDRMGYIMTVFLAIVAFAFVVSSSTPLMPYLTILDKLTIASYALTFLVGVETLIVALIAEALGAEELNADDLKDSVKFWDRIAIIVLVGSISVYYVVLIWSRVKYKLNTADSTREVLDDTVDPEFLKSRVDAGGKGFI